ncbi:MAG TPA: type II secretion system F family protein [Micromonosporaceae bacterium]|nr:type II secretion system F family protein [Micromonosporaceae bacterium]
MEPETLLLVGLGAIFLAITLTVVTVVAASPGRTGVARALETIDRVYAPGSASPREENLRTRMGGPTAHALVGLARALTPKGMGAWLQRWLDYAGNPPGWPPERIVEMQGVGLLVLGTGTGAFSALFALVGLIGWTTVVVLTAAGATLGLWLPIGILYDIGVRRQDQIRKQLPDALDLLTLSVEAGLGFDAAISQVANTMPGALAREFARLLHEMQMGMRRADAMRALAARTRVTELRTIAVAVVQATELGIPIANVLREQAREMRVRRRQRAEEQARKVPVKVVFPLILCLFPALFVVILGPGILGIMHTIFGR